ncbi:hypothetical protein NW762_008802 [Fusarium torreyae]|uniref:Uncharacterized protein n=1 Tax=Fusarium torreyae TaxID=1237075 RepID=A0A9W8RXR3_9HYPO|nr:hypothetical protein NW762_008802 [Fusarium torreyae]
MDGADAIVHTSYKELCKTTIGHHLLQSWADMRARRNRQRLPFRPLSVELQTHSHPHAAILFRYNSQHSGARLTSLLADADTLRNRLVLNLCAADEGVNDDDMPDHFRHWFSSTFEYEYPDEFDTQNRRILTRGETLLRLHDIRVGLQIWRSSQEPRQCFSSFDKDFRDLEGQWAPVSPIEPVQFPTPATTFDYLRYCLCLILSSPQVVNTYLLASHPDSTGLLVPSIVARMLSIIEGLDPAEVIHYDVYDTGPLWMLVTFVFCIPHRKIASYILDTVLPRFEKITERGPLLIAFIHTKNMISCILSQMENGIIPLYCAESSTITEDLILSPASRFGRKYAMIGRDASGAFRREVVES